MSAKTNSHTQSPSPTGTLTAGTAPTQRKFQVCKFALEKSPILKAWIDEPSTIPPSMVKDGSLYFPAIEIKVMKLVVSYLEEDEGSEDFDLGSWGKRLGLEMGEKCVFFVKVYKLALSLALEKLNASILTHLRTHPPNIETLLSILLEAERLKLLDCKRFRGWVIGYIRQNREILLESKVLRSAIEGGGVVAWAVCQVLVMGLGDTDGCEGGRGNAKNERGLLTPPIGGEKRRAAPDFVRGMTSYSGVSRRRPSAIKKRNLNATVEDANLSENEEGEVPLAKSQQKRSRCSI